MLSEVVPNLRNSHGSALVMVMAGVAITGIMVAGITTLIVNGQRETQSLAQKLEILQIQQTVMGDLADSTVCGCNFDPTKNTTNGAPLTFNSNAPSSSSINLSTLYSGCNAGQPSNPTLKVGQPVPGSQSGLAIASVQLTDIQPTGAPGGFRGQLQVSFDRSKMVISRHPASVALNFQADVGNPGAAKIIGCAAGAGASGSGGGGAPVTNCIKYTGSFTSPYCSRRIPTGGFASYSGIACGCPAGKTLLFCDEGERTADNTCRAVGGTSAPPPSAVCCGD